MGSPVDEEGRYEDESPQHRVTLSRPISVGKFEVTFAEFGACVDEGVCGSEELEYLFPEEFYRRAYFPVVGTSWEDAMTYVAWLSRKTGHHYRLLSEAEWEYAARAETTTRYSCGDNEACLSDVSNNGSRSGTAVGTKLPNDFALYDMHAGVWEWLADCYNYSYAGAPADGSAWTTGECGVRVVRGGAFVSSPRAVRSAARWGVDKDRGGLKDVGFRVARTPMPVGP